MGILIVIKKKKCGHFHLCFLLLWCCGGSRWEGWCCLSRRGQDRTTPKEGQGFISRLLTSSLNKRVLDLVELKLALPARERGRGRGSSWIKIQRKKSHRKSHFPFSHARDCNHVLLTTEIHCRIPTTPWTTKITMLADNLLVARVKIESRLLTPWPWVIFICPISRVSHFGPRACHFLARIDEWFFFQLLLWWLVTASIHRYST